MEKLRRSKKEANLLRESLEEWHEKGYLTETQKDEMEGSLEISSFNWKDIASSSFFFALACMLIAVIAFFADRWLMRALNQLVETPDGFKSLALAMTALIFFVLGWRKKQTLPNSFYSNETLFALGAFFTVLAIGYLGMAIGNSYGLIPKLLALASFLYFGLAVLLGSQLVWIFGILTLAAWFGSATAVSSDWQAYYRGMNYPLRFVIFGTLLSGLSFLLPYGRLSKDFFRITQIIGVSCLLFSLWLMSVFGNMGNFDLWEQTTQSSFLGWSFLLLICSLLTAVWGHRQQKPTIRDLGISFFIINIYTRYIEYCWPIMPKAIFFSLMALSFWLIGKQAERIGKLGKKLL